MLKDPGIKDDCFYIKAYDTDDGKRQDPQKSVWHSPQVVMFEPNDGNETQVNELKVDHAYKRKVGVNRRVAGDCPNSPQDVKALRVEMWVCFPSTTPLPLGPSSKKIGDFLFTNLPTPGNTDWAVFPPDEDGNEWRSSTNESDPDGPGYRCLVGRIYPEDGQNAPQNDSFYYPDEPHVAQNNILIGEAPAGRPASLSFNLVGANQRSAQSVAVRATVDTRADRLASDTLHQRLTRMPSFRRVATKAPQRFGLELPDSVKPVVHDNTRPGCLGRVLHPKHQPTFEAQVQLASAELYRSRIVADLSDSSPGDAHILNVALIGVDGRVQGGLTWAVIAV